MVAVPRYTPHITLTLSEIRLTLGTAYSISDQLELNIPLRTDRSYEEAHYRTPFLPLVLKVSGVSSRNSDTLVVRARPEDHSAFALESSTLEENIHVP